jgi:hypothetical protein
MQGKLEYQRDFQVVKSPADAPRKVVLQAAQQDQPMRCAMRTQMKAGGYKLAGVAAQLSITESYLSKLINERVPMPDWFAAKFCDATRCNLLAQVIALTEDMDERRDRADWIERKLAAELRSAA